MAINYPSTVGQATDGSFTHTASGITWSWDGTTWVAQGSTSYYVLPTSTTNTLGGVKIDGSSITISNGVISSGTTVASINDIGDVNTTGVGAGDILSWSGTEWTAGAPVAQGNAFQTITISGQSDVVADSVTDTLTFVAGNNITLTTNPSTDEITITGNAPTINALNDIGDVNTTGAANGKILKHDGTNWVVGDDDTAAGLQSRTTGAATTNNIANDVKGDLVITAAKSYILQAIETSHAAWVTVYTSSQARSNDSSRNITTDPLPGAGVIAEVITSDGAKQPLTPGIIGWNDSSPVNTSAFIKVVNKSGFTNAITVTLHYVPLEA